MTPGQAEGGAVLPPLLFQTHAPRRPAQDDHVQDPAEDLAPHGQDHELEGGGRQEGLPEVGDGQGAGQAGHVHDAFGQADLGRRAAGRTGDGEAGRHSYGAEEQGASQAHHQAGQQLLLCMVLRNNWTYKSCRLTASGSTEISFLFDLTLIIFLPFF